MPRLNSEAVPTPKQPPKAVPPVDFAEKRRLEYVASIPPEDKGEWQKLQDAVERGEKGVAAANIEWREVQRELREKRAREGIARAAAEATGVEYSKLVNARNPAELFEAIRAENEDLRRRAKVEEYNRIEAEGGHMVSLHSPDAAARPELSEDSIETRRLRQIARSGKSKEANAARLQLMKDLAKPQGAAYRSHV